MERNEAYERLSAYTLARGDATFMHQYVVDAYAVQTFGPGDKPIRLLQALVGLYLHVEHGTDGRQVQRVHKLLADQRPDWPALALPEDRGSLSVEDVMEAAPGPVRDTAIEAWAESTWVACRSLAPAIEAFLATHGVTLPRR